MRNAAEALALHLDGLWAASCPFLQLRNDPEVAADLADIDNHMFALIEVPARAYAGGIDPVRCVGVREAGPDF